VNRLFVAIGCLLVSLAAATASAAKDRAPDGLTLDAVNHALAGRRADITLSTGATVARASNVVVSPQSVSWRADGQPVDVPVAQVARITTRPKSRFLRSLGLGAGIGAFGGALIGASDASGDNQWGRLETGVSAAAGTLTGALVGAVIGGMRGRLPAAVVFEGPVDRYAVTPATDDEICSRYLVAQLRHQRAE
jgi:hypothetical protein